MDYPLTIPKDSPWISMYIRESLSSPNGTPFELRGFRPDQSRWFVDLSRFPGFHVLFFWFSIVFILFWQDPGAPREHPGATEDSFIDSWSLQGPFWVEVTFQEIPQSWNIDFQVFPVTVSNETQRNRCGIGAWSISNQPFISKTTDMPPPSGCYVKTK